MKKLIALSLVSLSMISCVKSESQKVKINLPEVKSTKSLNVKKSGLKCDITGDAESKEIFLKVESKDGKTTANFYNFTSADRIAVIGANFGDYSLLTFGMQESADDNQILTGETIMLHSDKASLSDEGKVMTVTGRLTLNEDMSGTLEQKLSVLLDDNTTMTTDFQEIAIVENCEEFEASWL